MKSKSIKNPKKWCPGTLRKRSRKQSVEKVPAASLRALLFGVTWPILGAIWRILGAIWGPAGRQGAPKNDLFGPKSHQKIKK